MTILHFDATTAAASTVIVGLSNVTAFDFGITQANASITTKSTGQVSRNQGGSISTVFNWIDPLSAAPGDPAYEVMRGVSTPDEVGLTGPAAGVWTPVTSNPEWGFSCTTPLFGPIIILLGVFTVSIRQGSGPVIDTATWTIDIECATLN